jgi:hypothetical protein
MGNEARKHICRTRLKLIGPIAPNWARTDVICSWLFKYIQQHTAGFTENNRAPHLLMPVLDTCMAILMYIVNLLF